MDRIKEKLEKIATGELPREHAWDVIALLDSKKKKVSTLNEIRNQYGLDPIDGGNNLIVKVAIDKGAIIQKLKEELDKKLREISDSQSLNKDRLTKGDLECIYRHLKMFIHIVWDKQENVKDACEGCKHCCSENIHALDPWKAFYKLSNLIDETMEGLDKNKKEN